MIPFDKRSGLIWYDGALVEWADATLHVLTHGLHYASSVFEGLRVYDGVPFMIREHLARLAASAEILDFAIPFSEQELYEATLEVVGKADIIDGYIRINGWRGSEVIQTAALHTSVHVSIAAWETPAGYYSAADALQTGISLQTARYQRPSALSAPIKSKAAGNYMIGTVCKNEALRAGFDDALLLDTDGHIAESTGAHVFFIRDGSLHTPTTRSTIEGITRACVLAIAEHLGIPCEVGDLEPSFAASADSAFICGTALELLPVSRIDAHSYRPGEHEVFTRLLAEYRALTRGRSSVTASRP